MYEPTSALERIKNFWCTVIMKTYKLKYEKNMIVFGPQLIPSRIFIMNTLLLHIHEKETLSYKYVMSTQHSDITIQLERQTEKQHEAGYKRLCGLAKELMGWLAEALY